MQLMSAYPGSDSGLGLHGCKSVGARILATIQLLFFLGSFLAFTCPQRANAELLLYIKETRIGLGPGGADLVEFVRIAEGDTVFDSDLTGDVDYIDANHEALNGFFDSRWLFDEFFIAFATLGENPGSGLPAQVINIEFSVTKSTSENSRLEVLATFKGSNGNVDPTILQMFGGGTTTQANLDATFVGSFSHDETKEFYTNDYVDQTTPTDYVFTFEPTVSGTDFNILLDPDDPTSEPSMPIDGDSTYSLTFGVRIDNLANGNNFTTASGMDYVLPEPTSVVMWASATGLAGLTARRKRRVS